jgi:hypothetical protein
MRWARDSVSKQAVHPPGVAATSEQKGLTPEFRLAALPSGGTILSETPVALRKADS